MDTLLSFLLFGALFFVMMRFGCGAHVMGHHHGRHGTGSDNNSGKGGNGAVWVPPKSDTDPVCGMMVDPTTAKSCVHDGKVYYFCADQCRQKFEADPALFTSGTAPRLAMEETHEH